MKTLFSRRWLTGAAICAALSGCVQHNWVPGPQVAAPPGMAQGQCKLAALGGNNGVGFVYAQGSPQFVGAYTGAAVLSGVISSAVRENRIYNACMEAQGYFPQDVAAVPSTPPR
jgi:hypothetical protein